MTDKIESYRIMDAKGNSVTWVLPSTYGEDRMARCKALAEQKRGSWMANYYLDRGDQLFVIPCNAKGKPI